MKANMKANIDINLLKKAIKEECELQGFSPEIIMGRARTKNVNHLRCMIIYSIIDLYNNIPTSAGLTAQLTYEEIGILTNRDHATILHIKKTVSNMIEIYENESACYLALKKRMANSLGILINDSKETFKEKAKHYWFMFRSAEQSYDIESQAKFRRQLDELLEYKGSPITEKMFGNG